jgi:site-specific recombinase XerD
MPENISDSVRKDFLEYLSSRGLSPETYKNYKSDLVHFIGWAILKVRSIGAYVESLTEIVPFLNPGMGSEYRSYMIENDTPVKTINRRLSTVRNLARFLVESKIVDFNFSDGLKNVGGNLREMNEINPIFDDFRSYLGKENVSPNTIKNYLSDIKHFLAWLENNNQQSAINN